MSTFDPNEFFVDPQDGELIELTQGFFTIVDKNKYEELAQFKWHVRKNKHNLYAERYVSVEERKSRGFDPKRRYVFMHCELKNSSLGYENGLQVDHVNNNGLDNRMRNLREGEQPNNSRNSSKNKGNNRKYKSKYKGVTQWI